MILYWLGGFGVGFFFGATSIILIGQRKGKIDPRLLDLIEGAINFRKFQAKRKGK